MHSFANMYGAFDVVLYFVVIQLFWLLINLLPILSYLNAMVAQTGFIDVIYIVLLFIGSYSYAF